MKRRFMAVLIALVMCLAAFSGCSALKGLERDVQVILQNEGEYVGTYTVNIFNNAVVPEMTKDGYQFRGWSVKDNWTAGVDSEELLSENTGLIRYDDIKDYIGKDSLSITLYAAYSEIPHHDLVIAWYNKETTSGLTQESIDAFQSELYAYLTTQGYTPEQMDIVIRGYSGDVGTTCSEIKKDGDVDIMIGWSSTSNITGTGGMTEGVDFLQNVGGVTIGTAERYAARLTNDELTRLVYRWIFDTYSETPLPEYPDDPTTDPDPEPDLSDRSLKIAWYNDDISGLNPLIIANFEAALKAYLAESGYPMAEMNIELRAYEGDVATSCGAIMQDGDIDIMLGWGKNIGTTGGMTSGTDFIQNVSGIPMGGKSRYIARVTDAAITKLVFAWLQTQPAQDSLAAVEITDTKLVIGWYAKTSTTGLKEEMLTAFETGRCNGLCPVRLQGV